MKVSERDGRVLLENERERRETDMETVEAVRRAGYLFGLVRHAVQLGRPSVAVWRAGLPWHSLSVATSLDLVVQMVGVAANIEAQWSQSVEPATGEPEADEPAIVAG